MSGFFSRLFGKGDRSAPRTPVAPDAPEHAWQLRQLALEGGAEDIEAGRDLVSAADTEVLARLYWSSQSWPHKLNLIELTQDHRNQALSAIAADFLRAPVRPGDERTELAKAIALGHIGGELDDAMAEDFDRFMDYYNDRDLLARKVAEALDLLGLEAEPAPAPSPPPAAEPDAHIAASGLEVGPPNDRLLAAATRGDQRAAQRALSDGADINTRLPHGDYESCTPLILACMKGHYGLARELLHAGADCNLPRSIPRPSQPGRGQTPVWWAAGHGHLDMVQYFAAAGAHLDIPDAHGSTPLHQAAGEGHADIAAYLLDQGADPHARIYDGRTPMNLAATNGQTDLVELFLRHGVAADTTGAAGHTPLMLAAEQGKIEMAETLLAAGADLEALHPGSGIYTAYRRWTPLVFAVAGGRIKITRFLIAAGANVHHTTTPAAAGHGDPSRARSVLDYCSGQRSDRLRELLIEAGAQVPQ